MQTIRIKNKMSSTNTRRDDKKASQLQPKDSNKAETIKSDGTMSSGTSTSSYVQLRESAARSLTFADAALSRRVSYEYILAMLATRDSRDCVGKGSAYAAESIASSCSAARCACQPGNCAGEPTTIPSILNKRDR